MNKKLLFLWSLYDFANSIIYVNFVLYFAVWIVVDKGLSDFWYNAIFAVTTVLLLLSAPALASRVDKYGGKKFWLNIATVGTAVGYLLAAFFASQNANVWLAALAFLVGQYFYQLAFVFFTPILNEVATEKYRSRASGLTQFASSLGFVAGIALALPFAATRTAPLLPAVIAFFVLALPMMIFYREKKAEPSSELKLTANIFSKRTWLFFTTSVAAPVLVSFFFFSDALITVSNNYSIYLERVFAASDSTKSMLLALVLGMSAIGAVLGGWVGDKIGPLKTLKFILVGWIIALPLVAIAPNIFSIQIITIFVGLLLGAIWTVSRSYLSLILPPEQLNYGFSFYTIVERFATLLGPLTWGAILWIWGTSSTVYRIDMAVMTIYVAIGLLVLIKWKKSNTTTI